MTKSPASKRRQTVASRNPWALLIPVFLAFGCYGTLSDLELGRSCGNGQCEDNERCTSCPQDCGRCDPDSDAGVDAGTDAGTAPPVVPTPGSYPPDSQLTTVPSVRPALPDYRQTIIEPTFGNKVTRISDKTVFGAGSWTRHSYSKTQAWNANMTLIALQGWPTKLLNAQDYSVVATVHIARNWSHVDPYKTYNTNGNRLASIKLDPSNGYSTTFQLIYEFTGYTEALMPSSEVNISNDDRYFVLEGKKSGSSDLWLIVFDQQATQIVGERNLGPITIDWASVSQSGEYIVLNGTGPGNGMYQGTSVFDRNLNYLRHLTSGNPHADLCVDANGDDVLVGIYRATSYRLSDGATVFNSVMNKGGHVSCRNIDRPGWAYISHDRANTVPTDPGYDEVFAVKLDGSMTVQRFTKIYSDSASGYEHQPHATVSRDGRKVLFASDWLEPDLIADTHPPAFVCEAP